MFLGGHVSSMKETSLWSAGLSLDIKDQDSMVKQALKG
jgi:hypothetical protein